MPAARCRGHLPCPASRGPLERRGMRADASRAATSQGMPSASVPLLDSGTCDPIPSGTRPMVSRGWQRSALLPHCQQSSFKLHQSTCPKGNAMNNQDEAQRIHPSSMSASVSKIKLRELGGLEGRSLRLAGRAACMPLTVCPIIHWYCVQLLLRLSVAVFLPSCVKCVVAALLGLKSKAVNRYSFRRMII